MKINRRSEGHSRRSPRQRPHRGKLLVAPFGLKLDHPAPIAPRNGSFRTADEGRQRRVGRSLRPAKLDHAPVVVDEKRLGQPLVGMRLEHASEDLGLVPLRVGDKRRVEPLGEEGGADVDLARGGAQRQIPFEPQLLERQRDNADDRDGDPDRNRRRNHPPANRRRAWAPHAFQRLDLTARPRPGEAKHRLPA